MNKLEALEHGHVTYNTGKACRRGHHADRYASSGSCVECVRLLRNATANNAKVAKGKRNLALAAGMREHKYLHSVAHHTALSQLCEILQYSPTTVIDKLKEQIAAIYDTCPNPRVLSRADLLEFIRYEAGNVMNLNFLNISYPDQREDGDARIFILHNNVRYDASDVMEVLRGQRLNVRPK